MTERKRRVTIHIETHEVTIIRSGGLRPLNPDVVSIDDDEVILHAETDPVSMNNQKEKEDEK